jgi:luciferase family oxidoreductase group 1
MKLSVLDHSGVTAGQTAAQAIRDSLALARHCDALGYHRYWVSEHHNTEAVAGTAPEVLIAAIAATTSRMRVGSGGVMLPHYAALKVAEQFRVLEAIAPGRIDLGIGRAPGSDGLTAFALNPHANTSGRDEFPGQLRDLLAWLDGSELAQGHPFAAITAQPQAPGAPEVWMLGSSDYGAQIAAHFGLPYCYAHFFSPGRGSDARAAQALTVYRDGFRPSPRLAAPYGALAVTVMAAETTERAAYELGSRLLWSLQRESGYFGPFPTPEQAAHRDYSASERAWMERALAAQIYGTGAEVAAGVRELATRLGADEMILVSTAHDPAVRRRSYSLMSQAFGLVDAPALKLASD